MQKGIWSRHQGGSPRPITDRIGMIKNPRYDATEKAVMVDGIFHGRSQASRDVIQMVEDGEDPVTDVSVEVGAKEVWNAETKRFEAASLTFYGFATVDQGACDVCKMRRNEAAECADREQEERKQMETKELEEKLAALETEKVELTKKAGADMAELTKQLETVSKARGDEDVAHKEAIKAFEAKVADYETRIKALEKSPEPPKTRPGTGEAIRQTMELEVLSPARIVNGEVSRA
jgi:DNA repair exonuclease SbcCD ATPase subunit